MAGAPLPGETCVDGGQHRVETDVEHVPGGFGARPLGVHQAQQVAGALVERGAGRGPHDGGRTRLLGLDATGERREPARRVAECGGLGPRLLPPERQVALGRRHRTLRDAHGGAVPIEQRHGHGHGDDAGRQSRGPLVAPAHEQVGDAARTLGRERGTGGGEPRSGRGHVGPRVEVRGGVDRRYRQFGSVGNDEVAGIRRLRAEQRVEPGEGRPHGEIRPDAQRVDAPALALEAVQVRLGRRPLGRPPIEDAHDLVELVALRGERRRRPPGRGGRRRSGARPRGRAPGPPAAASAALAPAAAPNSPRRAANLPPSSMGCVTTAKVSRSSEGAAPARQFSVRTSTTGFAKRWTTRSASATASALSCAACRCGEIWRARVMASASVTGPASASEAQAGPDNRAHARMWCPSAETSADVCPLVEATA